jgi:ABC-type branched-subunit amino acid transport system substrate-binding protein
MNNKYLSMNNDRLRLCVSSLRSAMKFVSLFIVYCSLSVVNAQVSPAARQQYQSAAQLVKIGDYERAKTALNPIIQRGGSLAPFASYYYALATFRQKNWTQARLMLRQLMSQFPDWRRREDAYYLFAAVCFETGLYDEALQYLTRIGDPDLRDDVDKLERSFLPKMTDLNQLKTLGREFPQNRNLGLQLIERIQQTSTDRADLELSDQLTNRFGVAIPAPALPVGRPAATAPTARFVRNPAKGYWNVAALLPFRLNEYGENQRGRTNQFVYDWYAGMKMAQAKLQAEGVTVNLFAYDLDNDLDKTRELVANPAFVQNDLVIGPLYAEPNRIIASLAGQQNMLIVNPIATNAELVLNQPMAFLAQPSVTQQARKGVTFMQTLGGARRAAVYFGPTRKDSLLAVAYQLELKRQGFQVLDFRKLSGRSSEMAAGLKISPANKPGHVFFATSTDTDGSRLLDALARVGAGGPTLISSAGFDYYQGSLSTFNRRDLYLLYPDFMDTDRDVVEQFRDSFLARWHIIPSVYAAQGYDSLLFFARQLTRAAGAPVRNVRSADTDDYVLAGFDYSQSNDNQRVPIVKFEGGRFKLVN